MEENKKTARNFREYSVYKAALDYATYVYQVTDKMPWFEKKGLCDQLQRAAVSISSNIAEGAHVRLMPTSLISLTHHLVLLMR